MNITHIYIQNLYVICTCIHGDTYIYTVHIHPRIHVIDAQMVVDACGFKVVRWNELNQTETKHLWEENAAQDDLRRSFTIHGGTPRSSLRLIIGQSVRKLWALFQLVVLQVELLRNLSPVVNVEEEVRSSLVRVCLCKRFHAGRSRYPDSLFLVISPVSVVPVNQSTVWAITISMRLTS